MPSSEYTEEMVEFLRKNINSIACKQLTMLFNTQFGTCKKDYTIRDACHKHNIWRTDRDSSIFTEEMINYLKSNVKQFGYKELTEHFNKRFGTRKKTLSIKHACLQRGISRELKNFDYTQEMLSFLRDNSFGISRKELTIRFNSKFKTNKSVQQITDKCHHCKFHKTNMHGRCFTEEMMNYISGIVDSNSWKEITRKFNEHYNVNKNVTTIQTKCQKLGILNKMTRQGYPNGSERINNGYVIIKTSNGWMHKHVYLWTQKHGAIPKDSSILFADGDTTNLNIDNLILVPRQVFSHVNLKGLRFSDPEATKVGINIAKVILKIRERQKEIGKSNVEGEIKQREGQ